MVMLNNDIIRADGLTDQLKEIFEKVSTLECIKGLYLCGGTSQSIQMSHRLSEDLDFELIGIRRERPQLDFLKIIGELRSVFPGAKTEILGDDHFLVFVGANKSKLSFFRPENPVKYIHEGIKYNNIVTPSLQDLLGMKLYTICVRTKTRDFYDIYCLLESGCSLREGISYASYLSRHNYKSRDMLGKMLCTQLYPMNDEFVQLKPAFDVTSEQMRERFQQSINVEYNLDQSNKARKTYGDLERAERKAREEKASKEENSKGPYGP